MRFILKVFWIAILCCFVAACSGEKVSNVAVITRTVLSTSLSTEIPTNTPVLTKTSTPKPSQTAVPTETLPPQPTLTRTSTTILTATPIPSATHTPSPTITPTPIPLFNVRYPTIEELEAYLLGINSEEYPLHTPFSNLAELIFEDVNGDSEADLIFSDYLTVSVLVWQDNHYRKPFLIQGFSFKYDPGSRIYFEDWTNDGVPEVVFDYRDDIGGTGVRHTDWAKFIIHCPYESEVSCKVIWAGEMAAFTEDYNAGGLNLYQAHIEQHINDDSLVSLSVTRNFFAVYSWGWYLAPPSDDSGMFFSSGGVASGLPDDYRVSSLNVFTSTRSVFTWDGNIFDWQNTEILEPAIRIDSQSNLEATDIEGHTAVISAEFNNGATNQNDICQLFVDGAVLGAEFGCKHNFTIVNWQDVTNDNQEELVITTLSGLYDDIDGGLSADKECVYQRLLIYQWNDAQLTQIANITGCVVQSDLYGVKIEDIDGDEQVEILAASSWFTDEPCGSAFSMLGGSQTNCWYQFGHQDEVYKWNGSEFAYWGLLSE